MKTLSELIESSGNILKDHLHTLVPCLLKATGELEMPKLSYLSTRLGANVEAQEAVDSLRAEAAKQHHSMETLVKVNALRFVPLVRFHKFLLHFSAFDTFPTNHWKK